MTLLALSLAVVLGMLVSIVVGNWLWRRPDVSGPVVTLTVSRDALYHRALVLTAAADQRHSPDHGEAKRHQVYSQLQKEFPAQGKRTLSRAIEAALVRA